MIPILLLCTLNSSHLIERTTGQLLAFDSLSADTPLLVPYRMEIEESARVYALPAPLIAAVIQEESHFDPWATRAEPKYYRNNIVLRAASKWARAHRHTPTAFTELTDRSRSYGLMQVMGETARDQGFDAPFLAELYLPKNAIQHGALLLRKLLTRYRSDTLAAISASNAGSTTRSHSGHHGTMFANARYVYRVVIAWHAYDNIWKRGAR